MSEKKEFIPQTPKRNMMVVAGIAALGIGYFVWSASQQGALPPAESAAQGSPPITDDRLKVAGSGTTNPEYGAILDQAERQRLEQAAQQGGTALPTPRMLDPVSTQPPPSPAPAAMTSNGQIHVGSNPERVQAMQAFLQSLMSEQDASKRVAAWSGSKYDPTAGAAQAGMMTGTGGASQSATLAHEDYLFLPGDTVVAIQEINLDSDIPSHVLARVVTGPYGENGGAKLVGGVTKVNDRLNLVFNHFSWKGRTYPVSAVAVSADDDLQGVVTEVDRHILYRSASLMGEIFLEGVRAYGEAASRNAGTVTIDTGTGAATAVQEPLSSKQLYATARGEAAGRLAPIVGQGWNRPTTVRSNMNQALFQVIFLEPVPRNPSPQSAAATPYPADPAVQAASQNVARLMGPMGSVPAAITPAVHAAAQAVAQPATQPGAQLAVQPALTEQADAQPAGH